MKKVLLAEPIFFLKQSISVIGLAEGPFYVQCTGVNGWTTRPSWEW
jgi:hypothetical protein